MPNLTKTQRDRVIVDEVESTFNKYYSPIYKAGSPTDISTLTLWKRNCNITDDIVAGFKICEDHFDNKSFMNEGKNRLVPKSVPICADSLNINNTNECKANASNNVNINSVEILSDNLTEVNKSNDITEIPSSSAASSPSCCNVENLTIEPHNDSNIAIPGPSTASDHSYSDNVKNDNNFDFLLHTDKTGLLNEMGLKKIRIKSQRKFYQKINNMSEADRCCSLIFDEMSLSPSFYYDANNQLIYGYEDLGHLGRINKQANHALVFMVRGLRKTWKQVVAYYFTSGTISAQALKQIIVHLISELQNIGLKVFSTVCDQDSYMKMKVKVAAQQLSHSVAACIETWVAFKDLPSEAAFTAEFCHLIDSLFDSLNSSNLYSDDGKKYRCALTEESPHVEFWSEILQQMRNWQLIDISSGQNVTNQYSFIKGWQTTIKSVIFLWNQLKNIDSFTFLCLRNLNQDPVENLFGVIRQHGVCNNNPTCHQFVAALKTTVLNNLSSPNKLNSNCLDDSCTPLANIKTLLAYDDHSDKENKDPSTLQNLPNDDTDSEITKIDFSNIEDNQASAYVAGYILNKINIPNCDECNNKLFSKTITNQHLFVQFKEYDDRNALKYASEPVIYLIERIHELMFAYLESNGHLNLLETKFKDLYKTELNVDGFCSEHVDIKQLIIDKAVRLVIYKYVKEKNQGKRKLSSGHFKKMKKFKDN
ncbi:hypothetical protein NQ315_008836 [Exocentrus adspersus]|uniref:Transposable element P transposase n=1 Tax=Exocentrus adspersus TaxID=1586481 RepID=A0AAV8VCC4_9CUCU|nr:hypothetical protein NQ315_008836 [Exocentrus adspersus]